MRAAVAKSFKLPYKSFGSLDHCFQWDCLPSCSLPLRLMPGNSLWSINTSLVLYDYDGNSDLSANSIPWNTLQDTGPFPSVLFFTLLLATELKSGRVIYKGALGMFPEKLLKISNVEDSM